MANWFDLFKNFSNSFTEPPLAQATNIANISGAGISAVDALSLKDYSALQGNKFIAIRGTDELVDLSLTNAGRFTRYLELERLRSLVEVETAITIYANEACVSGHTKVVTPFGDIPISRLAEEKKPDEKFLVYCYDFAKKDFTLGWAFNPRKVRSADRDEMVHVLLSNGDSMHVTEDHRVLLRDGTWVPAGDLPAGSPVMLFNRVRPTLDQKVIKDNRWPRILTLQDGWQTEHTFVTKWSAGGLPKEIERDFYTSKGLSAGLSVEKTAEGMGMKQSALLKWLKYNGIHQSDIRNLKDQYSDTAYVIGVFSDHDTDVYDLSVQEHENFATTVGIMHNCQLGENGHSFEIRSKNKDAQKICEKLCHDDLELDDSLWPSTRNLCLYGDEFWEAIIDPMNPKDGILKLASLPASTMYRIETIKGTLLEFQQSGTGSADISALSNPDIQNSTTGAIRFTPQQIIHLRLGGDRRMFYPYGESVLENAKSAAHQLRLMEDAMTVYRLTRSPSRRVFYVDVGQMPPAKVEWMIERAKDQFRKKKTFNSRSASGLNSSGIEERWNPMSFDEDIWLAQREGQGTRVETISETVSWSDIADIIYFRNKLLIALGLPKSYLAQEDPSLSRLNLSSQDIQFAKRIQRMQMIVASGIRQLCHRHLELIGFPTNECRDLRVKLTPSSAWWEISQNEVIEARFNRASAIKGAGLMSDFDILVEILKYEPEQANEFVSRMSMQKIGDMKLEAMSQNPKFLGLVEPGPAENEMGVEPGGPAAEINPEGEQPSPENQPAEQGGISLLPVPTTADIDKYDLHIRNYARDKDVEDIDVGELDNG